MSDKKQPDAPKQTPQQLTPEEQREQREARRDRAQVAARFLSNMDRINELEEELRRTRLFHQRLLAEFPWLGNVLGEVNRVPAKRKAPTSDVEMGEAAKDAEKAGESAQKRRRLGRAGLEKTLRALESRARGVEKDELDFRRRMEDK